MEIPINAETMSKPWFRALLGIICIIAGYLLFTMPDQYSGVTRESCTEAEVTLYELRFGERRNGVPNGMWLIFDDYDLSLNIHSSCITNELDDAMRSLKKGAKMKILHSNKSSDIYELTVNGKMLLDFDTANKKINENASLGKYISYFLMPVGAVLLISVPVMILIKKKGSKEIYLDNN